MVVAYPPTLCLTVKLIFQLYIVYSFLLFNVYIYISFCRRNLYYKTMKIYAQSVVGP